MLRRLSRLILLSLALSTLPAAAQPSGVTGVVEEDVRVAVQPTMQQLLAEEDTDGNRQITVEDDGDHRFVLHTVTGASYEVAGAYPVSNLLQELALAGDAGTDTATIQGAHVYESPVHRISRMISDYFWDGLTRRIDSTGLAQILGDTKAAGTRPRLYVPHDDTMALHYYRRLAARPTFDLEVVRLPVDITPEYVRSINDAPGLLALKLERTDDGTIRGLPFVVPGGRFNEMYGWDSYFIALGLLEDGRVELAHAMVDHFVYQIEHYGQILNANRSYYLTRSQPPFLTSMALAVYDALPKTDANRAWLADALRAAIREYETVWTGDQRLTPTGLSRYRGSGLGMPPETEPGHYDAILRPYAEAAGLSVEEYAERYRSGAIEEPELDRFFVHDRAVRESGHDTSYRLMRAANIVTVDLNALLYKYETDLATALADIFNGSLQMPDGRTEQPYAWRERALRRKAVVDSLLWNEAHGLYLDYDFMEHHQTDYVGATTLYPLWAGMASPEQAAAVVENALPLLEAPGGLLAGSKASGGVISEDRPQRQWDYPHGWAPHQMLAWRGLEDYGYGDAAQRLAYRWLYTITRNAVDYNGTVPEKYDVVDRTHKVFAEYGNVGTDFDYITREGFGWMNASYQVGLDLLPPAQHEALAEIIPPEWLFGPAPVSR